MASRWPTRRGWLADPSSRRVEAPTETSVGASVFIELGSREPETLVTTAVRVSTGSVTDVGAVLGAERSRADRRLASLRAELASVIEGSRLTTDDDEHDPEGSTIAFERAKIAALITDTESEIREIDGAVSRLTAGTYGSCERCGSEIPAIRLEALPAARRCVQCVRLR